MPEKSQKRKLRSDPSSSLENVESTSQASDENTCLTEQDFSDISNKIENRLSKRLRDAEFGQREILKLIENLAAKVDGLSNSATEPSGSVLRHDIEPESIGNSDLIGNLVNVSSNTKHDLIGFSLRFFSFSVFASKLYKATIGLGLEELFTAVSLC